MAERQLPKLNVAGSIPVSRSIRVSISEATVHFITLEDMRGALLRLLVVEMDRTLTRSQERLRSRLEEVPVSTEEEIERLVGEALHKARRSGKSSRRTSRS